MFVTYYGDAEENRALAEEFERRGYSYRQRCDNIFWRERSVEIQKRDDKRCRRCGQHGLHLQTHHCYYRKYPDGLRVVPWDYPDASLITLCDTCHQDEEDHIKLVKTEFLYTLRERGIKAHDARLIVQSIRMVPLAVSIKDIVGALWAALSVPDECRRLESKFRQNAGQIQIHSLDRTKLADAISERGASCKDFALFLSALKKPKPDISMSDIAAVVWSVLSSKSEFSHQLRKYRKVKA